MDPEHPHGPQDRASGKGPAAAGFVVRDAEWARDESALRAVRQAVFVVEQHVPIELEWDGIDAHCRHLLALDDHEQPVGCARLLPDGRIGRMAVLVAWRGRGVGRALLRGMIARARAAGLAEATLHAQVHALGFYAREGFRACGPVFDDAGIPHRPMVLPLQGD